MLSNERQNLIVRLVNEHNSVTTDTLMKRLEVSKMTLWRDLKTLEENGKLRRVHGAAVALDERDRARPANRREREPNEDDQILRLAQKEDIGRYAARTFVREGQIIILEGGTTVMQMVQFLTHKDLTLVSHGLNTLVAASKHMPHMNVIGCGGVLRESSFTFVGPDAESYFRSCRADTVFLSGEGLTIEEGITDPNPLEIQVKRAMCESAGRVVALMNSYKIGKRSLSTVIPLRRLDALVTDAGVPENFRTGAETQGVDVHVVG